MTTNNPLSIGTKVIAYRPDGSTARERIYNVISQYDERKDTYDNTYWLRNTVGPFKKVEEDTRKAFKAEDTPQWAVDDMKQYLENSGIQLKESVNV